MIDWLYRTSLEVSVLIGLVLLLRPLVKRTLGAKVAYGLWLLPLIRIFLPDRPQRSDELLEVIPLPAIDIPIEITALPSTDNFSATIPWEMLWLAGIALWLMLRTVTWLRFHITLQQQSQPFVLTPLLKNQITDLLRKPFARNVCIYTCNNSCAPFVTGVFKPRIYLPHNFLQQFSKQEQTWVLVHELTHIKRNDLWVQLLGEGIRALFWFNPIIHLAIQFVQEDQELACDSTVLANCNQEQRYQYGRALAAGMGPHLMPPVLRFFSTSKERFAMLSKHKVSTLDSVLGITLCGLISVFALTKAPESIAQRPVFDEVYDADAPVLIRGEIVDFEQFNDYSLIYVNSINKQGAEESWAVEGGSAEQMQANGLTKAIIGRSVVVRGYQTLDKSCDPVCKMNGRDLEFTDG